MKKLFQLTEQQKLAIAEGRNQIREGKFLTDEQANLEIEQWLNQDSKAKKV